MMVSAVHANPVCHNARLAQMPTLVWAVLPLKLSPQRKTVFASLTHMRHLVWTVITVVSNVSIQQANAQNAMDFPWGTSQLQRLACAMTVTLTMELMKCVQGVIIRVPHAQVMPVVWPVLQTESRSVHYAIVLISCMKTLSTKNVSRAITRVRPVRHFLNVRHVMLHSSEGSLWLVWQA